MVGMRPSLFLPETLRKPYQGARWQDPLRPSLHYTRKVRHYLRSYVQHSELLFLVLMNVRTEPLAISALACDSYACMRLKVVATLRRLGGGGSLCKDCGLRTA